ncbi:hypothetical protein LTR53_008803 [Teratosphaeriaceae sp. CCFEE 6253]|nr:hypothetical protein LTR53_008803 [Teratosphaeriaceae sp. CCFEE 6253]
MRRRSQVPSHLTARGSAARYRAAPLPRRLDPSRSHLQSLRVTADAYAAALAEEITTPELARPRDRFKGVAPGNEEWDGECAARAAVVLPSLGLEPVQLADEGAVYAWPHTGPFGKLVDCARRDWINRGAANGLLKARLLELAGVVPFPLDRQKAGAHGSRTPRTTHVAMSRPSDQRLDCSRATGVAIGPTSSLLAVRRNSGHRSLFTSSQIFNMIQQHTMAGDKAQTNHVECPDHEAALSGALALANLFSTCVEAFGLIHPSHKWEKEEQQLLSRLGIQQARLLIWGDAVGITSPPASVTNHAVPKHPSSAYPDLKEPTFFGARDARLDEAGPRSKVEDALSAIVDRSAGHSREEMMEKYGLKAPKRLAPLSEPALDIFRLDAFREKYELLQEVGQDYAQLSGRRSNSMIQTSWTIADQTRFYYYLQLTKEKLDFLIELMGVKDRVDRSMRMDIKALGWHLTADRRRIAQDVSKLRLLQAVCKEDYPEYVEATQIALDNITREAHENAGTPIPYTAVPIPGETPAAPKAHTNGAAKEQKRPSGLFGMFKKFGKSHDRVPTKGRSMSVASTGEPPRSLSDAGPTTAIPEDDYYEEDDSLDRIRSKSVGAILDTPAMSMDEEFIKNKLEAMRTQDTVKEPMSATDDFGTVISRHDRYHGISRTATKDQRQGW